MSNSILPVYARHKLSFVKGEAAYLFTASGERYIDFTSGIAVNSLGHAHPKLTKALYEQAQKLWHVSNLFTIDEMDKLGNKYVENCFADKVFFCNSGAEAVECGIKMIRKYHDDTGNPDKFRIITFSGSFHGRTMAAISASNRARVMDGFGPALDGFDHVEFDNIAAVENAITEQTGGIFIEPIQGEGGIKVASKEFLTKLRNICDKRNLLLMLDEVQCGFGRTGKLFAHQNIGVTPDIITCAKGIGGGFPLGACLASKKAATGMIQGTHGTTYGGNPLAMAVANAVFDEIYNPEFLNNVKETGEYFFDSLQNIDLSNIVTEIRGLGLMIGIKIKDEINCKDFVARLQEHKLLTVPASDNVVRILPPLIIGKQQVDEAIFIIQQVYDKYYK
ncbi:MAG: aspartate aminotransferase family protein [Pseudomonadota bacterium]